MFEPFTNIVQNYKINRLSVWFEPSINAHLGPLELAVSDFT